LKHFASSRFWQCLESLPAAIQLIAHRNYALLKQNPQHPSLQFKSVGNGRYRSVRVGLYYRALGMPVDEGIVWFWIGSHADYDKLLS
jgi:hypothetical protein